MNPYELDYLRTLHSFELNLLNSKLLFIHIPKTAGCSIASAFNCNNSYHTKASDIPELFFSKYYSFTFVRDPIDRCISAFYYLMKNGMNQQDSSDSNKYVKTFPTFSAFVMDGGLEAALNEQIHFIPQYKFLEGRELDFIGRYECLNEDLEHMLNQNNLPPIELSKKNCSFRPKHFTLTLKRSVVKKIKNIYEGDFELFDYS